MCPFLIQVHTLISCLRVLKPSSRESSVSSSSPPPQQTAPSTIEASMYHSTYVDHPDPGIDNILPEDPHSIAASMYYSAYGMLPDDEREMTGSPPTSVTSSLDRFHLVGSSVSARVNKKRGSRSEDVHTNWAEHIERSHMKKLSAQLSINEALLTISSLGRTITEISVPGVKVEFLKRPYDSATRLLVQDLCIVDRIQTFGPEYELVVCSSGRSLLGFSPLGTSLSPSSLIAPPTKSLEKRNLSCLSFVSPTPTDERRSEGSFSSTSEVDFEAHYKTLGSISPDLFNPLTKEEMSGALCALAYTHVSPLSPEHPAMKDLEQEEIFIEELQTEPNIHRINLQCTAIDAIGRTRGVTSSVHACEGATIDNVNQVIEITLE